MMFFVKHWKLLTVGAVIISAFMAGWWVNGKRMEANTAKMLEQERELLITEMRARHSRYEKRIQEEIERSRRLNARLDDISGDNQQLRERIESAELYEPVIVEVGGEQVECPDPTASREFWRLFGGVHEGQ